MLLDHATLEERAIMLAAPTRRRPLQFPTPAFVRTAAYVGADQKVLDAPRALGVELKKVEEDAPPIPAAKARRTTMDLTLKGLSKNGKQAFYAGAAQVIRISVGTFPNKIAPQSISVPDGTFEPAKAPKAKETKEERKARLAAMPKPTEAERIAKAEEKLAKRKAKLAAATTETM